MNPYRKVSGHRVGGESLPAVYAYGRAGVLPAPGRLLNGPYPEHEMNWGVQSYGARQLAWCILCTLTTQEVADMLYKDYCDEVVSQIAEHAWVITREEVEEWVMRWLVGAIPSGRFRPRGEGGPSDVN